MKRLLQLVLVVPLLVLAQPNSDGAYFNGTSTIVMPSSSYINATAINNRTYEMYFKAESTASRQILMKEGGADNAILCYIEDGYLIIGAYNNSASPLQWQGTFYRTPVSAKQWYHIALVIDNAKAADATSNPVNSSANKALKLYLDGVLIAEQSGYEIGEHSSLSLGYKNEGLLFPDCSSWQASATGLSEFCFGNSVLDETKDTYYFKGNIWGFRLWRSVLSQSEIIKNKETILANISVNKPLLAVLDGDTMSYISDSNSLEHTSLQYQTTRYWKKTASSSIWNDASNWEANIVPVSAQLESVIIPSDALYYPVVETHVKVGDITLESGATLEIKANATLDIHYDLRSEGEIKVNNNGSLLLREGEIDKYNDNDDGKIFYEKGTVILDRTTPNYPEDDFYSYWSSPMLASESRIGNFFKNDIIAYKWDLSKQPGEWIELSKDSIMQPGVGYAIRSDYDFGVITRTFSKKINNGDIYTPLYDYGSLKDSNLIGNPYTSALDWDAVYNDNKDVVMGTIYFWRQTYMGEEPLVSDYIPYNLTGSTSPEVTGYIGSGQAVIVEALKQGDIVFKNSQRVAGNNTQFFKSIPKVGENRVWLSLSSENKYHNALLGYLPGATDGFDNAYEAILWEEGFLSLYSILDDKRLLIQGKQSLKDDDEDTIPLGFEAIASGNYSISILKSEFDDSYDLLLEDKTLNTLINLREKDYNFTLDAPIIDNSRFLLHIKRKTLHSTSYTLEENSITAYVKENILYTDVLDDTLTIDSIEVYNVSGKSVLKTKFTPLLPVKLASGAYLIVYKSRAHSSIVKKIIFN